MLDNGKIESSLDSFSLCFGGEETLCPFDLHGIKLEVFMGTFFYSHGIT
jgi:hypothetical protein